ncbi:MAG: galactokinase [Balneolaceae bacterium]|jgi:galactokinase
MNHIIQQIKNKFISLFDNNCILIQSPGRVNLIGEHTDYNDGFVLPAAISKSIVMAMALNSLGKCRFYAFDKQESFEADLVSELHKSDKRWPNYLLGVIDRLQKHGYNVSKGFDCVFGGNVPIGAGLSSSAALEGGVLFGLAQLFDFEIPPVEMAKIAQEAENKFVGVQCGIMDQFISLNGKQGHAMKLDCRSLEYEYYPFQFSNIRIVLCDTQVRRELASSEYNLRREQCEQGVEILQKYEPEITSLRDVSPELLKGHKDEIGPTVFRRCKYVIEENERVLQACHDLQNNDLKSFGKRMFASHTGLRNEYEVSCKELDILVDAARNIEGVMGARMMGGGFGGCTINLVDKNHLELFTKQITETYFQKTDLELKVYTTKVSGGTHLIEPKKVSKMN